ncbi:MAG: hypothetical protein GC160_08525 [Acidobacteria bacterium]|nr:hypothetical protein [Acidobacteriota bacterium]
MSIVARGVVRPERRTSPRRPEPGVAKLLSVGEDDQIRTSIVQLRDISEGGYGVLTDYKLPIGELVWLQCDQGEMQRAAVRYSRHLRGLEWRSGLYLVQREQRRRERDKVQGAAFLSWTCPTTGSRKSTTVKVCDVSEIGAGVIAEIEPPVGSLALLRGETMSYSCVVRHTRLIQEGHRVGLVFAGRRSEHKREFETDWLD